MLTPRSITALKDYSLETFRHDLAAGLTVGLVALPLAMAFAVSSGVSPQAGISCAILSGFLISALGGSRYQIGGPTGAFVVVVAGIVSRYGLNGLFVATMMAGGILVVLGATGLGSLVKFIPQPVVLGFTNGIAVTIASTQVRDFFGLQMAAVPSEFIPKVRALMAAGPTWSPATLALGVGTVAGILIWRRFWPRVPAYIVALLSATIVAALFHLPVATIGSRFGGLQGALPAPAFPHVGLDVVITLIAPAMTIAMLGAVESLMSAVVADRMGNDRHNPNMELIAQGVANLVSPLFGGIPATGAIARTATNIRSGARTPFAGMFHAVTLLIVLLAGAQFARFVPLAVLAAILLVVASQMGEWHAIPTLLRLSAADIAVWGVTFGLTVVADLTVAVEVGLILAMFMAIRKVSNTTSVENVTAEEAAIGPLHVLHDKTIPDYVAVYRVYGPLLFGATEQIQALGEQVSKLPPIVILKLRNMTAIDATGLHALTDFADQLHKSGRSFIVCGALPQPDALMRSAEFHEHIGLENICPNTVRALERAVEIHEGWASVA
jgi:SulP family sulfate permease